MAQLAIIHVSLIAYTAEKRGPASQYFSRLVENKLLRVRNNKLPDLTEDDCLAQQALLREVLIEDLETAPLTHSSERVDFRHCFLESMVSKGRSKFLCDAGMPVSEGLIHSRDPRARSSGLHPAAFASHVVPGSVMWLPPRGELPADFEIDDGCYNHPVVVLFIQPLNGKVVFMLLTSLREMDLAERHPHKPSVRCAHLPIDPSKPHPDNQILLKLDDRSPMLRKKSYVKTEKQYTISYKLLREYDRRNPHNYVLSKAFYKTLVEYVQFPVPTPLPQNLFLCGFTNTGKGQIHSSVHRSASIGSSRVISAVDASPSMPLLRAQSPLQRLPGNPQPWVSISAPYGKYPVRSSNSA